MTEEKPCRHEFVKIIQRRLKGLERRLVSTKAYLPVGFKMTDFAHLSEGSYCFCAKCRARLFPRRTAQEKAQARLALAQGKLQALQEGLPEVDVSARDGSAELLAGLVGDSDENATIHVEELEVESPDVQDIEAEGVKINDEEEPLDHADEEV